MDKDTDLYCQLAKHLDRLPGGYPATESGVELRILRRLFSPQDAALALHLTLLPEEARVIAHRADLPGTGPLLLATVPCRLQQHVAKDLGQSFSPRQPLGLSPHLGGCLLDASARYRERLLEGAVRGAHSPPPNLPRTARLASAVPGSASRSPRASLVRGGSSRSSPPLPSCAPGGRRSAVSDPGRR